jgi:hypothetical protein
MNPLNSKSYPKLMYLALIVVSLLILFNSVNILETANNKMHEKTISGFAIENDITNLTTIPSINLTNNNSMPQKPELYSSKPYIIFYIFLIGIVTAILITFLVLRSTIDKDIELEENERKL